MYPHETTLFSALVTAATVLLLLVLYFILAVARYHRRKMRLSHEQLSATMLQAEQQQAAMALELHDDIGNDLSAVRLHLELQADGNEELLLAAERLGAAIQKIRQLCFNIMPSSLEKAGLTAALLQLASTIPLQVHISCEAQGLSYEQQLHIFRMVQELLGNAMKHAAARHVAITAYTRNGKFFLRFRDDGKGFNREPVLNSSAGTGIRNLQHRAELLHANLYLVTQPGKGVTWQLEMPL